MRHDSVIWWCPDIVWLTLLHSSALISTSVGNALCTVCSNQQFVLRNIVLHDEEWWSQHVTSDYPEHSIKLSFQSTRLQASAFTSDIYFSLDDFAVVQYLCLCLVVIIVGGLFQTSWDQKPSVLPPGTLISFSIKQRKKSISAALLRYLTFNKAPHHSISQPVLPVISLILIISSWLLSNTSQTVSSVAAASASGQLMKHSNTAWSSLVQPSSAQLCQAGVAKKCWRALIKPPRSNIFSILQIFQIVCTGFMTQYLQVNQGERYQRYQR